MSKSLELFDSGFNCAESVLKSLAEKNNINVNDYFRIASGFGGGIGHTGHICGALSGAVMFLGLWKDRNSNPQNVIDLSALNEKLISRFRENFEGSNCNELTGCDPLTDEGKIKFKDPARRERCKEFVDFAYNITMQIVEDKDK